MLVRRTAALCAAIIPIVFMACADDATNPNAARIQPRFDLSEGDLVPFADPAGGPEAFLVSLNQGIAAQNLNYAVREASMLLAATADPQRASTVYANDRLHRLGYRFVKNDPRRGTVGAAVRQATFLPLGFASTGSATINAKPSIDASFATWNGVQCANLSIVNNALPANVFPSAILNLGGFIENPLLNDINTAGFLPGSIFNLVLGPGASTQVLGVTFPFVFVDAEGNPTDIDGDGNDDLAFAEIWYNAAFRWNNTGTGPNADIETVTLHENGHALGLNHFGKIAVNQNGKLHVSPRAVMNAIVLGTLRSPLGTDNAGFCGIWEDWN
jgi:hypothetical protein